jgi:hypothetical protein
LYRYDFWYKNSSDVLRYQFLSVRPEHLVRRAQSPAIYTKISLYTFYFLELGPGKIDIQISGIQINGTPSQNSGSHLPLKKEIGCSEMMERNNFEILQKNIEFSNPS